MSRRCARIALTMLYPVRWLAQRADETRVGAPAAAISVLAASADVELTGERETDTALA